jgi:hypothetical protein
MSGYFSFRCHEGGAMNRGSLVLFSTSVISANTIAKALKNDVERNLTPDAVYVISSGSSPTNALEIKNSDSFKSEFSSFVGDVSDKLIFLNIDQDGSLKNVESDSDLVDQTAKAILQAGMLDIFKRRKGLITSSPSYHFLKPSGDHCDKFIRASNLLVSGEEVSFLAISLLPHFEAQLKRVYVDTSSISYLVSTALQMSRKFDGRIIPIESFESYSALKNQFDFVEDESSLVLVSATTSGSLAEKISRETGFTRRQVLTLFHKNLPLDQKGVFDISSAVPFDNFSLKSDSCHLCKKGSRLIRIVGDQFLPETPKHELLLIRKADFDKSRSAFIKEFATKGILSWEQASDPKADSKEHFFVDVEKMLSAPTLNFEGDFRKKIKKHLSRDVKDILYLDDSGSVALANYLRDYLGGDAASLAWRALGATSESALQGRDSVMVIAGAITSGRRLLDASRKLRGLKEGASITYLVGFSKLPNGEALSQLRNDLKLGGHELVVLREAPMPRIKGHIRTAWDWEAEELNRGYDQLESSGVELTGFLKGRAQEFEGSSLSTLFLPTPKGEILKLRQTFAFWSGLDLDTNSASQADVYWTMQAILHDLRIRSDEKGLASTYHSTLISPACFDRFNDGIIQAAILRAAEPAELNYAIDEEFSRKMTDVIISVLENHDDDQGEASLEFLMALVTGRVKLCEAHMSEIIALSDTGLPQEMGCLIGILKDQKSPTKGPKQPVTGSKSGPDNMLTAVAEMKIAQSARPA